MKIVAPIAICVVLVAAGLIVRSWPEWTQEEATTVGDDSPCLTFAIDTEGLSAEEIVTRRTRTAEVLRSRASVAGHDFVEVEEGEGGTVLVRFPERERGKIESLRALFTRSGKVEFRIVARDGDPTRDGKLDLALAESERLDPEIGSEKGVAFLCPTPDPDYPGFMWFPEKAQEDDDGRSFANRWKLVRIDRWNFTGADLTDLKVSPNAQGLGDYVVRFSIKTHRQNDFGDFTGPNSRKEDPDGGRFLAIILDGKITTCPVLNSRLTEGGYIEGDFTLEQARELVTVLIAGSLPGRLRLVS
jgi:preprotein translocase subunit SecD